MQHASGTHASEEPAVEQVDYASMLRGVGGCKTPLGTLLSKMFSNSWLVNSPPQPNQKPEVSGF